MAGATRKRAFLTRIRTPLKYQAGRTFITDHGVNVSLQLLTFLDLKPDYFRGYPSISEEIEDYLSKSEPVSDHEDGELVDSVSSSG